MLLCPCRKLEDTWRCQRENLRRELSVFMHNFRQQRALKRGRPIWSRLRRKVPLPLTLGSANLHLCLLVSINQDQLNLVHLSPFRGKEFSSENLQSNHHAVMDLYRLTGSVSKWSALYPTVERFPWYAPKAALLLCVEDHRNAIYETKCPKTVNHSRQPKTNIRIP